MRLQQFITEGKKLSSPMIGYGIDPFDVKKLKDYLVSELTQENIRFEEIKDNHITISQILGTWDKDELVRATHSISTKIHLYPKKLSILRGKRVPKDFIVIEFHPADKFVQAVKDMGKEFYTMKFPKIVPHTSLFMVRRGTISDELMKSIADSAPSIPRITPIDVELWNAKHEKEYTK